MPEDNSPATKGDIRRLEAKMDRRDVTLFGEDGRGGIVADVNRAKQAAKLAVWLVTGVGFPVLVGLMLVLFIHP